MLFVHSFLRNALLASLALTSFASPIAPHDDDDLAIYDIREAAAGKSAVTPPLPTVQQCKDHLSVSKDSTLFYSGPGGYAKKARDAIKTRDYLKGYKILATSWTDPNWQNMWQNDEAAAKKFFDICSQALAELSSGTVYTLLPAGTGTNWQAGTVWADFEWPNIPASAKVIRINPDDPTAKETIKG